MLCLLVCSILGDVSYTPFCCFQGSWPTICASGLINLRHGIEPEPYAGTYNSFTHAIFNPLVVSFWGTLHFSQTTHVLPNKRTTMGASTIPIETSRQVGVLVISALCILIPCILVALRFVAKRRVLGKLDASDYCIFVASVRFTILLLYQHKTLSTEIFCFD